LACCTFGQSLAESIFTGFEYLSFQGSSECRGLSEEAQDLEAGDEKSLEGTEGQVPIRILASIRCLDLDGRP